ncbi:MAG: DMT family transporter [Clostridiales bacterium]|nr:DMT family transporter [Clostridiales bacterium]MCF8021483.1 DMT family transporter [Clostridiales bacterium]
MQKNNYPLLAAVLVAVIFGFSFIFTKNALFYLSPFQLIGLRFATAALCMTFLAIIKIIPLHLRPAHMKNLLKIAIWQPVIYFTCETYGIKYTSASESGIIVALVPVTTAILSLIILKEKINFKQGIFINAAVIGVIIMTLGNPGAACEKQSSQFLGFLILFGAVLAAGFYNIFSRRASTWHSPLDITFIMMWLGAITFNLVGILQSWFNGNLANYVYAIKQPPVITSILYLGILSSIIAFFMLNYTLSNLTASRTAVFLNLTPVVSVLAGVFFLNEHLGPWQLLGGGIILLGVWGTNYFTEKQDTLNVSENKQADISPPFN